MPVNQYENVTQTDGSANEQSARVATEQQHTNSVQQQVHSAERVSAPDPRVEIQHEAKDDQIRKQQSTGMSMSVW